MSQKSDKLEEDIKTSVTIGEKCPEILEEWIKDIGISPDSIIISSKRIGSESRNNKTDVIIAFNNGAKLKISAKLTNADYFGNWYGHNRFSEEFGQVKFELMTTAVTNWANNTWKNNESSSLFVGVSINFGKRTGDTALDFLSVFEPKDILKIVAGNLGDSSDETANCLYVSDNAPENLEDLLSKLRPVTLDLIESIVGEFKIACRPINPVTEGTNRGKNIYTKFVPTKKLTSLTIVDSPKELNKLGVYKRINLDEENSLNHNHVLDDLRDNFNIVIPRKDSYDLIWNDSDVRIIGIDFDKNYPISTIDIKKGTKKITANRLSKIISV